jgi:predicted nucleic acid-binding protein
MSLVLDSSATLAWVYTEESTPAIQAIFRRVVESGAWVPGLWKLEVANILETGARRGRHTKAFRDATLRDLSMLPVQVDPETDRHAWNSTLRLAERHRLRRCLPGALFTPRPPAGHFGYGPGRRRQVRITSRPRRLACCGMRSRRTVSCFL